MGYQRRYQKTDRGTPKPLPPPIVEKIYDPSPQQQAIYDWITNGEGNAIIVAVAGAGKTSTLLNSLSYMKGSVAFAAYNKKIADEIAAKISSRIANGRINPNIVQPTASTFHSFGFQAWRRVARGQVKLDYKKTANLMTELAIPPSYQEFVKKAYSLAKQTGIGALTPISALPEWREMIDHYDLEDLLRPTEGEGFGAVSPFEDDDYFEEDLNIDTAIELTIKMLKRSIQIADTSIDFDDMIYLPVLHKIPMIQYDWVLVDEAQDSNRTRRALAKMMLKSGGRFIAVGDPAQAIYGFTGADSDALEIIKHNFNAVELPLTITYRCPKSVVELAHEWVSHIEADPSAPEGTVETKTIDELMDGDTAELRARFHPNAAVLCRNTKPLVDLAYKFIQRDVACHVEGKDIGYSLILLIDRFPRVRNLELLVEKLQDHGEKEAKKLKDKGQEYRAEALWDRIESLINIAQRMDPNQSVADLKKKITDLFADIEPGVPSPNLTLSTIHKSKGREWPVVYWLGRGRYQPSRYATQSWQQNQEKNLMYVAATRSQSQLVEVVV